MMRIALLFIICFSFLEGFAQNVLINGRILSINDSTPVANALITDIINRTASSDDSGRFSINVICNNNKLSLSHINFKDTVIDIERCLSIQSMTIYLVEDNTLEEVVISEERFQVRQNVESSQSGLINIPIKQIAKLPVFLGELDILKSIQLLPGVQSGTEASSGYYIRGGGSDQNLVLLDGAEIYNPTHAAGFLSIFNMDMIQEADLYKAGFPAEYGGRLSSVVDIKTKAGDFKEWKTNIGIGLVTGKITAEGPIIKDKLSFIGSFRSFYSYSLIRAMFPKQKKETLPKYYFYDMNIKLSYRISERDRITLSAYTGRDKVKFSDFDNDDSTQYDIPWNNTMTSLQYQHYFNGGWEVQSAFIYTGYAFRFGFQDRTDAYTLKSGIQNFRYTLSTMYTKNERFNFSSGAMFTKDVFKPNVSKQKLDNLDDDIPVGKEQHIKEISWYAQTEHRWTKAIGGIFGVRMPIFIHPEKTWLTLEPRVQLKYQPKQNFSIKASYQYLSQFVHLLSASTASTPLDLWIPSSKNVAPQASHQASIGYFQNFKEDIFESSVELYYKKLYHQLEFKEGTNIFNSLDYETILTSGEGQSYGAEFFLRKRSGKWNGFASYTLAWSTRQFPELNNGKTYYAKYDRRHDFTLAANYELNEKWSFSALFVFGSGHALTLPTGQYFVYSGQGWFGSVYGNDYDEKNGLRLRPYHRLDIGVKYVNPHKRGNSELRIDIYNVYSNKNPFFAAVVKTTDDANQTKYVLREYSILPIIPSIAYTFYFRK